MTNTKRNLTPEEIAARKEYRRKRKIIFPVSRISFVALLIISLVFYLVLNGFGVIPKKIMTIIGILLLIINAVLGFFALYRKASNKRKLQQSIISAVLSVLMAIGCIAMPVYKAKIQRIFNPIPVSDEVNMNLYVLDNSEYASIEELAGAKIGVPSLLNEESRNFAVAQINKKLETNVEAVTCDTVYDAVERLYNGTLAAILINEDNISFIEENDDFKDFSSKARQLFQCVHTIKLDYNTSNVDNITSTPFIVGILGNDEWTNESLSKTSGFRTDVNMVVVVNPNTMQVLLVSLPRDSYVANNGDETKMDKLTHATAFWGIDGWKKTVNTLLDIEMNYTFKVNFSSFISIIDGLGGIDIDNPYEMDITYVIVKNGKTIQTRHVYEAGKIHLTGEEALGYVRERYSLPGGDLDRNKHQQIVLKALIDTVTDPSVISKINPLLKAMEGTYITDMKMDQIFALAKHTLDAFTNGAKGLGWKVMMSGLTGKSGSMYSMQTGQYLSMVELNEERLSEVKELIKKMMNNEKIVVD